jgi:hypothetical protein
MFLNHLKTIYSSDDGRVFIDTSVGGYLDGAFLHLELNNWSISKYKLYRKIWIKIQEYLLQEGYKDVYALPPDDKEKLIKMFGLEDTGIRINTYKLLRKELV